MLTGIFYPISASWQGGGGWLSEAGFSDFAGSTVVHATGAAAALAAALATAKETPKIALAPSFDLFGVPFGWS